MWVEFLLVVTVTPIITTGLEPLTTGFALGTAIVGSVGFTAWCHFKECCTTPWIRHNITSFDEKFDSSVFGQPLVKDIVSKGLRSHFRKTGTPQNSEGDVYTGPQKALVFSFHGGTGTGKNYVAKFVAESMFSKGLKSQFAHFFSGPLHFPESQSPEIHQLHVQDWIRTNVSKCQQSLFIFDEVDKMHPKILNAIKPFIDTHESIDNVDFRKSVFVLLSNSGGTSINSRTYSLWQKGRNRQSLKLGDFEDIIQAEAFHEKGGLQKSELIVSHLVDYFVPFLPMDRGHVRECALQEIKLIASLVNLSCDDWLPLAEYVVDQMSFLPLGTRIFSETGCKRVNRKVEKTLETIIENLEGESDLSADEVLPSALLDVKCKFKLN